LNVPHPKTNFLEDEILFGSPDKAVSYRPKKPCLRGFELDVYPLREIVSEIEVQEQVLRPEPVQLALINAPNGINRKISRGNSRVIETKALESKDSIMA
jgi:hypothetical protein